MRAPANMPAAPQPFEPAGLGPNSNQQGDMDTQLTINPLASSDVGGTAGHDAAACVSARGKCDGASVCNARDARVLISPTTRPARHVVAPQARNIGADAAASELPINPTIENAGIETSAASTINPTIKSTGIDTPAASISKDSTKGKITAYFVKSTADGRARRSAVRGPPPFHPIRPSAGVAPIDAGAPAGTPLFHPIRPSAGVAPIDAAAPSVLPSVSISTTPAGVALSDAVARSRRSFRIPTRPSPTDGCFYERLAHLAADGSGGRFYERIHLQGSALRRSSRQTWY